MGWPGLTHLDEQRTMVPPNGGRQATGSWDPSPSQGGQEGRQRHTRRLKALLGLEKPRLEGSPGGAGETGLQSVVCET